jgi:hypothetical protein
LDDAKKTGVIFFALKLEIKIMSQVMKSRNYEVSVAEAEAASAKVIDPELRRIAFGKILDQLLSESAEKLAPSKVKHPESSKRPSISKGASKRAGPGGYLEELVDEGFFLQPKSLGDARAELANRGHHIPSTSLSGPLQSLCQRKRLRRQKKIGDGGKGGFVYSNW